MKQKFTVTGMTCAACSARVEKVTQSLDGVRDASVNLLGGSMVVEFDEKKTDAATGKALNINGDTARKIRIRALEKIKKEYRRMKGSNEDV